MAPLSSPVLSKDPILLGSGLPRRTFATGDALSDSLDAPDDVHLLISGGAGLGARTPFGPYPVATLKAPAILGLSRAVTGTTDVSEWIPLAGSEAVVFRADEARAALFAADERGAAMRRIALYGVTSSLRDTTNALTRFFDELPESAKKKVDSGEFPAFQLPKAEPIDPSRVYDLLDAAGLNPAGLPDLGLVARSIPPEGTLVQAGTEGNEAYLLAEGRLRVSLRIPGVGTEALAVLGPGEIVGEMALIDEAPRSADVLAHDGQALVYALSRDVFRRLLDSGDAAGAPLLAGITIALTRRLDDAIRKAAAFRVLAGPFG